MEGTATGVRGDDTINGTEVKGCSKIDQSDKCKDCKETVLRSDKSILIVVRLIFKETIIQSGS